MRQVIDVRNLGLVAGIELESIAGKPGNGLLIVLFSAMKKGC